MGGLQALSTFLLILSYLSQLTRSIIGSSACVDGAFFDQQQPLRRLVDTSTGMQELLICAVLLGVLMLQGYIITYAAAQPHGTTACTSIFSHRGRTEARTKSFLITEEQLLASFHHGVRAFDLDLVWTADGVSFVGHPGDLKPLRRSAPNAASRLPEAVFDWSSQQLEESASDHQSVRVLRVSRLLELASQLGDNLTLALDLKGGAHPGGGFANALDWLHSEVVRRKLQRSVWLWVSVHDEAVRLNKADSRLRRPPVRLGKPLYDVGALMRAGQADCSTQLNEGDAAVYSFLGPSLKCANANLLRSPKAAPFFKKHTGFLTWVIDDLASLRALQAAGVRAVISNVPVALRAQASGKATSPVC